MIFQRSLSDSRSPQVFKTFLSVPADFNNAVCCMVFILPLTFNSFCLFSKPLWTVPRTPISISITIIFIFHCIFSSLERSKYLSIFSLSFIFAWGSSRTAKFTRWQSFFLVLLFGPRFGDPFVSPSPRKFCLIFSDG